MPDGAELMGDQVIEPVSSVWGRGQSDPVPGGDLLDHGLERRGRDVVTLVHDHLPVALGDHAYVAAARQRLERRDVHLMRAPGATPAELARLDAEELPDAGPPLVGERLAVDQDEGRRLAPGDQRARHNRLARSRWRHQNAEVMRRQCIKCASLRRSEGGCEHGFDRGTGHRLIGHLDLGSHLFGEGLDHPEESAGQDEVSLEGLIEGPDEPRDVPR